MTGKIGALAVTVIMSGVFLSFAFVRSSTATGEPKFPIVEIGEVSLNTGGAPKEEDRAVELNGKRLCEGTARDIASTGLTDFGVKEVTTQIVIHMKVRKDAAGNGSRLAVAVSGMLVPDEMTDEEAAKICSFKVGENKRRAGGKNCECSCVNPAGDVLGRSDMASAQLCGAWCRFNYGDRGGAPVCK